MSKNQNLQQIQKELRAFFKENNDLNDFLKWASRKIIRERLKQIKERFRCEVQRLICDVSPKNIKRTAVLVKELAKDLNCMKKGYIRVFFKLYDPNNEVVKLNKTSVKTNPDAVDVFVAEIQREFELIPR